MKVSIRLNRGEQPYQKFFASIEELAQSILTDDGLGNTVYHAPASKLRKAENMTTLFQRNASGSTLMQGKENLTQMLSLQPKQPYRSHRSSRFLFLCLLAAAAGFTVTGLWLLLFHLTFG